MTTEAEFTRPSDACPYPERWHAWDAMATEHEVVELVAAFVRALQPDVVVETGTHHGHATWAIGRALQANGQGHLWSLEIDPDAQDIARRRVDGLPVTLVLGNSLSWQPPAPIDFAWFDSEPLIRAAEYQAYRPWMHARTVVGFHDTAPQHMGRCRDRLEGLDLQLLDLPTPRGVTFGRVLT